MRHLIWFSDRCPRFREHMCKHQAECDADPLFNAAPSTPAAAPSSSKAPQPQYNLSHAGETPSQTVFTDQDWDDFVRYAAARPNGMEPIGNETPAGVWKEFADKVIISTNRMPSFSHSLGPTASQPQLQKLEGKSLLSIRIVCANLCAPAC